MPCYRCGARQTDPVRGPSPWRRGVRRGEQVLVCPDCQRAHDWSADMDRCRACGSAALRRALGETRCKDCGHSAPDETSGPAASRPASDLSADVAAALDRVLGRSAEPPTPR